MKKQKAIFKPFIQGKAAMDYPRAGEIVTVIQETHYSFTDPHDPLCEIVFKDGTREVWLKSDLEYIH